MKYSLERIISDFLDSHWDGKRALLLAFSGGPDSLALLHLLLNYRKSRPLGIVLAHVDHGWRPESRDEVRMIALMAEQLGLPLHTTTLCPEEMGGNLEAACREARLKFFASLCDQYDYQAVLVAHHADDLAETVLKRVFEGSSLPYLCGLRPAAEIYGARLWRPLLSVPKTALTDWLDTQGLKGFDDHTNRDPQYLRARFRTQILPQLSKDFGKQVCPGLCRIGADATELRDYLDSKLAIYLDRIISNRLGFFLDLSRDCPTTQFEAKYLIRRFCDYDDLSFSRENVDTAAALLREGIADKQVVMGDKRLYIDRRRLFLLPHELPKLPQQVMQLAEGIDMYGRWSVSMSRLGSASIPSCTNWRSLWQNEGEAILPEGEYYVGTPDLHAAYPRSSPLGKWWTSHKIPAFLRLNVPIILDKNGVVHEFLTGKMHPKMLESCKEMIKITISP